MESNDKNKKYINNLILEVCLDARIESGIVDINNLLHREIIAENLLDDGMELSSVMRIVNELAIRDGKYPDRQAYNKEGWLVTFPSPDYKNAAIKRGTHFASDPTHGKGGMNVYYKRKGKQKRMTQQNTSVVEPAQADSGQSNPAQPQQPDQAAAGQEAPVDNEPQTTGNAPSAGAGGSSLPKSDVGSGEVQPAPQDADTTSGAVVNGSPQQSQSGQSTAPTAEKPVAAVSPSPDTYFVSISIEFAKSKQWNPTPHGEWKNSLGETAAVVGLSGEVVPIKSTDREELKLFSAKKAAQ